MSVYRCWKRLKLADCPGASVAKLVTYSFLFFCLYCVSAMLKLSFVVLKRLLFIFQNCRQNKTPLESHCKTTLKLANKTDFAFVKLFKNSLYLPFYESFQISSIWCLLFISLCNVILTIHLISHTIYCHVAGLNQHNSGDSWDHNEGLVWKWVCSGPRELSLH